MFTENKILIRGKKADVSSWVRGIALWPRFFPHYRWVKIHRHDQGTITATMAATYLGIPLRWTSELRVVDDPWPNPIAHFHHIGGITKGMDVEWLVRAYNESYLEVSIVHHLRWPWIGRFVAQRIVGDVFIKGIASKTLGFVKHYVESGVLPHE